MKEINATEAKAHLAELLRAVERGESFAITRHGKPVARLVPSIDAGAGEAEARRRAIDAARGAWGKTGLTLEEILAMRHEGHRY